MTRRPRPPLLGAVAGVAALVAVWAAAFHSELIGRLDAATLAGYVGLDRGPPARLASALAHLCDPLPFALMGALVVAVALARRRPDLALGAGVLLAGASVTTQMLKPLLGAPRAAEMLGPVQVSLSSWPSGHSTAAMALALAAVLVSPPARRPLVAAVGGLFAVAVPFAVLVLGWHFPSDVLAGYLVAGTWTLAVLAALWALPSRARTAPGDGRPAEATLAPTAIVAFAAASAVGLVVLARPEAAIAYAHDHTTFVAAAAAIAAAALAGASGLALVLRRPGA